MEDFEHAIPIATARWLGGEYRDLSDALNYIAEIDFYCPRCLKQHRMTIRGKGPKPTSTFVQCEWGEGRVKIFFRVLPEEL